MKRRRIMRRVIVFVFLGAIINLAIAWGSVLWRIAPWGSTQFAVADPNLPPLHLWDLAQTGTVASMRIEAQEPASGGMPALGGQLPRAFSDFIPRLFERSAEARGNGPWQLNNQGDVAERVPLLIMEARGWPCMALRCEWDFRKSDALNDGIRLPPRESRRISGAPSFQYSVFLWDLRALPYRPIWE